MFKVDKKLLFYCFAFSFVILLVMLPSRSFFAGKMTVVQLFDVPLKVVTFPFRELKKVFFYHRTYNHYVRLKAESDRLKKHLIDQKELTLENQRLRRLLDFKERVGYPSLTAHVIGRDPNAWSSSVILDRGQKNGVRVGMPVVSPLGVVGKVIEVGQTISRVILLTDPNFSVGAVVQGTRDNGLVSGTLQGLCRLKYVSATAQLKPGDTVITSVLSSTFPVGFLVGTIARIEESQSSPTIECLLEPAVNVSQIEEVLILTTPTPEGI